MILDISPLSDVGLVKIFSQSVGCRFVLLTVSFVLQKLCNFMRSYLSILDCLSQGFYSWTKHHDQEASWGGKGLFSLHFHIAVHYQRRQDWNSRRSGSRSWCRGHGGMFLTGLLPLACSACFLIEPKTTRPRMAPPTMGPPTLDHWENTLQLDLMEAFHHLKLLSLW